MKQPAWAEVDGVSLRYVLGGPAAVPLVVLVHEMGGSLESYDALAAELETRYRVLRYDMRGSGMSELGPLPLRHDILAADALNLMKVLGHDGPAVILGAAIGGAVALSAAAQAPDRVAGLVLCCPATGVPADRAEAMETRARDLETVGVRRDIDIGLGKAWPVQARTDPEGFERMRQRRQAANPHGVAALTRMLAGLDLGEEILRLRLPVLVLAGLQDGVRPAPVIRQVANAIRGADYREIDAGHFMHMQAPGVLAGLMREFIDRHLRAGATAKGAVDAGS